MDPTVIREWFSSIVGAVSVLVLLYVSLRKTPAETKTLESSADKDDASTSDILEQTNTRLAAKVDAQDRRIEELKAIIEQNDASAQAKIDELEAKYERVMQENADLRDWAERLVHQVQSLGAEPVKLRVRARPL